VPAHASIARGGRDRTLHAGPNVLYSYQCFFGAGAATRRARRVPIMILCEHTFWVIPNSLQLSKTITKVSLCSKLRRAVSAISLNSG
jgi:hypothetical protein